MEVVLDRNARKRDTKIYQEIYFLAYLQMVVPLLNTAAKTFSLAEYMLHEELSLVTKACPRQFDINGCYASFQREKRRKSKTLIASSHKQKRRKTKRLIANLHEIPSKFR